MTETHPLITTLNGHLNSLEQELAKGDTRLLIHFLSNLGNLRQYSFNNQMLILMQFPAATQVAGYREWQRLGRQVRAGEKGIQILVPLVRKNKSDLIRSDEPQSVVYGFRAGYVFDISQTDGPAVPSAIPLPEGELSEVQFSSFLKRCPHPVKYSTDIAGFGRCEDGQIFLHPTKNRTPAERFSTLIHEWAHAELHGDDALPAAQKELEAEAVAFAVCAHLGIDTLSASTLYLQVHSRTAEELQGHLQRVSQCARGILACLTESAATEGLPAA